MPDAEHRSGGATSLALTAVAGLVGAAGVALAAVAAHKVESPAVATAAQMLMVHAAAAVGIAALAAQGCSGGGLVPAGALMLAAVCLFAGDVTVHALTGSHLFAYAAPTGGSLTILSWLVLAVLALRGFLRRG